MKIVLSGPEVTAAIAEYLKNKLSIDGDIKVGAIHRDGSITVLANEEKPKKPAPRRRRVNKSDST